MNRIEHIVEPGRLFLVWQSNDPESRIRRIVGKIEKVKDVYEFQYHSEEEDFKKAIENGFKGYPAFNINQEVHTHQVLETFFRRLPPPTRGDFQQYLERFGISNPAISPFALLGYSEAKLPGDGFSIVHPFENVEDPCELLTEVAGFRYYEGMKMDPQPGEEVWLQMDPNAEEDMDAVQVLCRGVKIGNINRVQRHAFLNWLIEDRVVGCRIDRINGTKDRPRVILFVQIKGK